DPLPAGADLYLLKNVLADWGDAEASVLLRRCATALGAEGRLVIIGGASPDERGAPAPAWLMMVRVGGRERRLSDFHRLATASGSITCPSVVICLRRRARYPSRTSVSDARPKIAAPTSSLRTPRIRRPSNFVRSTTTSSGTRKIRPTVSAFGRFMERCEDLIRL